MIFLVKRTPFSPSGQKVAARLDEGGFMTGNALKTPPHTSPIPQFFFENAAM